MSFSFMSKVLATAKLVGLLLKRAFSSTIWKPKTKSIPTLYLCSEEKLVRETQNDIYVTCFWHPIPTKLIVCIVRIHSVYAKHYASLPYQYPHYWTGSRGGLEHLFVSDSRAPLKVKASHVLRSPLPTCCTQSRRRHCCLQIPVWRPFHETHAWKVSTVAFLSGWCYLFIAFVNCGTAIQSLTFFLYFSTNHHLYINQIMNRW